MPDQNEENVESTENVDAQDAQNEEVVASPGEGQQEKTPAQEEKASTEEKPAQERKSILETGDKTEPDFTPDLISADALDEIVPEGVEITDKEALSKFVDLINNAKSRTEIASGALALMQETFDESQAKFVSQWEEQINTWQAEIRNDKELGGEALGENLAKAQEVLKTYAGDDYDNLIRLMTLTGAGDNVHMIRFLTKVADSVPMEARAVKGDPQQVNGNLAEKFWRQVQGNN